MEVALVEMAHAARPGIREPARVDLIPFSPERRRMATLHTDGSGFVVFVKGALDRLDKRRRSHIESAGCR
jgi:sodium/potassium-transporting ATPase subunit alpha